MNKYKIIENKNNKTFYLINTENGVCIKESENKKTLESIYNKINNDNIWLTLLEPVQYN
jgi:hypothetical protein